MIHIENLCKQFYYHKKELGLKNSVKSLFSREKLVKDAVKNVSFDIESGEMVGFLGPNGAGKTTTLKMLSGILYPTSGIAEVAGYIPWERKNEFKRKISIIMGQKNQLWWDLPANESLYLNKCIYDIGDKEYNKIIDELTELLDVKELLNVQVRRLSLGERMKMELVAALIHSPKIILLDEPTIGLDSISQKKIREFLKNYNMEKKATILLTSHNLQDIEDLCQRAVVISKGNCVFDGKLKAVNEILGNKKILSLQFDKPMESNIMNQYGEVLSESDGNYQLKVESNQVKDLIRKMLDDYNLLDFTVKETPLEDGIELLYKKGE